MGQIQGSLDVCGSLTSAVWEATHLNPELVCPSPLHCVTLVHSQMPLKAGWPRAEAEQEQQPSGSSSLLQWEAPSSSGGAGSPGMVVSAVERELDGCG